MTPGGRFAKAYTSAACEVGREAARRPGLPDAVRRRGGGMLGPGMAAAFADLPVPARVLAAADACQAMTQPRPHRGLGPRELRVRPTPAPARD